MSFTKNLYRSKLDSILTDMHCNIMKSKVYLVFEEYYYLRTKNQSSESSIRSYIIVLRNDKGSDVEEKKKMKKCVGRESNPDLLLGRQQC